MKIWCIIIVLALSALGVIGCKVTQEQGDITKPTEISEPVASKGMGGVYYFYDEVHDVSVWVYAVPYRGGIAVLPGAQVSNPDMPMK